jgi:hypothetical protein
MSYKFDAAESAFVTRALIWVETETYNTLFPILEGRQFVPTDNSVDPGAKVVAYRQYTRSGVARLVTERGTDLPNVTLFVKEFFHQFYTVGASYQYNYLDLLASKFASSNGGPSMNIDLELALAAREAVEKKLDLICAVGSGSSNGWGIEDEADVGLLGLLNNPNATVYITPVGSGGGTAFSTKTPDEILADLTGAVAAQIQATYKVFTPDSYIFPVGQFEALMGRSMGDGRSDTVLSYFQKTNQHIKNMGSWLYCNGAGVGGTDRMVAYKKDPRFVRHVISLEFTQLPAQQEGLTYKTPCLAKTAGVIMPYPLSVTYIDGI